MKTYQVQLPENVAAVVDRMLEDGPWESIDDLMVDCIDVITADDHVEIEPGDLDVIRRKALLSGDLPEYAEPLAGEEVFQELVARIESHPALAES